MTVRSGCARRTSSCPSGTLDTTGASDVTISQTTMIRGSFLREACALLRLPGRTSQTLGHVVGMDEDCCCSRRRERSRTRHSGEMEGRSCGRRTAENGKQDAVWMEETFERRNPTGVHLKLSTGDVCR